MVCFFCRVPNGGTCPSNSIGKAALVGLLELGINNPCSVRVGGDHRLFGVLLYDNFVFDMTFKIFKVWTFRVVIADGNAGKFKFFRKETLAL